MNKELELREVITVLRYIVENKTDKDYYTNRGLEMIKKAVDYIENSIPKEVIEEKIEESKENGYWDFLEERDYEKTMNILQELLEGK